MDVCRAQFFPEDIVLSTSMVDVTRSCYFVRAFEIGDITKVRRCGLKAYLRSVQSNQAELRVVNLRQPRLGANLKAAPSACFVLAVFEAALPKLFYNPHDYSSMPHPEGTHLPTAPIHQSQTQINSPSPPTLQNTNITYLLPSLYPYPPRHLRNITITNSPLDNTTTGPPPQNLNPPLPSRHPSPQRAPRYIRSEPLGAEEETWVSGAEEESDWTGDFAEKEGEEEEYVESLSRYGYVGEGKGSVAGEGVTARGSRCVLGVEGRASEVSFNS
ncbi:hypothetical protein MMC16_005458 [Acarospora aff. strigata]|nr:hypothetical protein [Acarospora aff. strigata]